MFAAPQIIEPVQKRISDFANSGSQMTGTTKRSQTKKEIQERQRAWLRELAQALNMAPSAIAAGAHVSESTLTRILNSKGYTGTLTAETIERIKSAYKVPGPEEYAKNRHPALIGLSEASRFDARKEKGELGAIVQAILRDRDHVDPWRLKTMALEAAGYLPGDIVFVEALADGEQPKPQDAVCAQVVDYQHGAAETVWRVYLPPFLVAASLDRTAYKPLLVDGERVKIAGVIRESYRPHSLSATR